MRYLPATQTSRRAMPRPFLSDENGGLSVEAVIIFPLLLWAVTATFVFWDAFKTVTVSEKAAYVVADMLSRETQEIDPAYLTSAHEVYDFLSGNAGENALRVSVVAAVTDPATNQQEIELVWSQGVGGIAGYQNIESIEERLPRMAIGDQLIVVESEQSWAPAFAVGLDDFRFQKTAVTRPRFAPQLVWDETAGAAIGGRL